MILFYFLKLKRVWYHWDNSFINITIYFYTLHLFELKHFCVCFCNLYSLLFYVYLVFISVLFIF